MFNLSNNKKHFLLNNNTFKEDGHEFLMVEKREWIFRGIFTKKIVNSYTYNAKYNVIEMKGGYK